jgi:putative membrane protein
MRNTNIVIVIAVIVLLAVLLLGGIGMMGFGGFGMMGPGMMGGYGMMRGYGSPYGFANNPIGGILSLVFWALIIAGVAVLVVWLVRSSRWTSRASSPDSAVEILKSRYARGEITKDQFNEMKGDL